MTHLRLFLWSLFMSLVCIGALIGYVMLIQDWIAEPPNEEVALTSEKK